jgi:hypothetical protein
VLVARDQQPRNLHAFAFRQRHVQFRECVDIRRREVGVRFVPEFKTMEMHEKQKRTIRASCSCR